ncbi:N,N'-diacetylchitobiose transport system permease protein [Allocatelliglobosispora scoriae]|uniref:N,N'-diacetylchitobiose transport system permease protein n=1 Tax=Allocatelliglobosispora scoriae TaxID=643052 RepID=A0A841C2E9_9ACTN|nr:sugar ABC transporter permease [Allocatelliglobosispora scoriae]MBB5873313.1 N,N'-diacetylchitobiose transport system permease protein [Allocatelliglobosispora scoriae]
MQRRDKRLPFLLIAPSVIVLIAVLGYPLARVVVLSFQRWGVEQIFSDSPPPFVGLENYSRILSDGQFWTVLWRTLLLTAVMVAASMLAGVGIALLMERVHTSVRRAMTFVLVLAWAVPSFVSTQIFGWMTQQNFGVLNHLLGTGQHNWYVNSVEGLGVATVVVVWGAVPFIAITTYAGLTQVPAELIEAARIDGASGRQVLTRITMPLLRPILVVVTSLSVIWDFQVFNQIWILRNSSPETDYQTLTIYAYMQAYAGHEYGYASSVAVVTIALLIVVMVFYLRQIVRMGDVE